MESSGGHRGERDNVVGSPDGLCAHALQRGAPVRISNDAGGDDLNQPADRVLHCFGDKSLHSAASPPPLIQIDGPRGGSVRPSERDSLHVPLHTFYSGSSIDGAACQHVNRSFWRLRITRFNRMIQQLMGDGTLF